MANKQHFTIEEKMSLVSPGAPDFFLLPKKQWNMLRDSLKTALPVRELAMWALVGITGGVSLGGLTSYFLVGVAISDWREVVYVGIFIVLLFLCAFFLISAVKNSTESTAKSVHDQMIILEPGLRAATIGLLEESRKRIRRGLAPEGYYLDKTHGLNPPPPTRIKARDIVEKIERYTDTP